MAEPLQSEAVRLDALTVSVVPEVVDFGVIARGASGERVVQIVNRSTGPATLHRVVSSCSCTTASGPSEPIPPGGKADLIVRLKSPSRTRRPLAVELTLSFKEDHEQIALPIRAKVVEIPPPAAEAAQHTPYSSPVIERTGPRQPWRGAFYFF